MLAEFRVGEALGATGTIGPGRSDITGAAVVTDGHGRFNEIALRTRLFSGGMGLTSISNVTFTSATLGATCTPIIGIWNPLSSTVNVSVLQAMIGVVMTALQATGGGPYVWAASVGNGALTLGAQPFNRRSFTQSGSTTKVFAGVALTGLTNNLVVLQGSGLMGGSAVTAAFLATQAGLQTQQLSSVENLDGSFIVPPGGVLALLATTTPVAHSAVSGILFEDIPVLN